MRKRTRKCVKRLQKGIKMKVNYKKCLVLIWDKRLKKKRQCRNKRTEEGTCCVIHSTAWDCGDELEFVK